VSDFIADLLVRDAKLVAACDDARRELPGGWVAITGGVITGVGAAADPAPEAATTLDASGCLVTPGLINTHHHMYQNLTRSYGPAINGPLFSWLAVLYPLWARIDEEAAYLSAWVGLAELAPDSVVQDDDEVLADSERLVRLHHDPSFGSMVRVALAPCALFSVSPALMRRTAELAEKLDVRLHTHLAEDPDEDTYCLEQYGRRPVELFEEDGWLTSRAWVAHGIYPSPAEVTRLGAAGVGVAHCPTSNMLIGGGGFAPVREFRTAGAPVGLGCDGSACTDSASLWVESRAALLLGRQRLGPGGMTAREVLDIATRGSAACLGRAGEIGELSVGAAGDLVCWPQEGVRYAGALVDPVEAWLRCGPASARHTVVAGKVLVRDGELTAAGADVEDRLRRHAAAAARVQGLASGVSGSRR